jgi:hypothetical protein
VLQNQAGVDEVEGGVRERAEVVVRIEDVSATFGGPVVFLRQIEHGGRDIDAGDVIEPAGKRLRIAADTAAEVERAAARGGAAEALDAAHHRFNLVAPCSEEFFGIPAPVSFAWPREDGPKRVMPGELVPLLLLRA